MAVLLVLSMAQIGSNPKDKIVENPTSTLESIPAPGFIDNFDYKWPSKSTQISPNGRWEKIKWEWQDGLIPENVFTIDNPFGQLCLRVKKDGRGGQVNSISSDYHYGLYKARIKASRSTKNIAKNKGVCSAFFVYWQKSDDAFEEIDVEILSKEPKYVYFTIHRGKDLFNPPREVNWSISKKIRVKGKRTDKDFHEYGFKWLKDRVEFFIDDFSQPVWVYQESDDPSSRHIPGNQATLILNNWTGSIYWTGSNPKKIRKMYVDWVEYIPIK